MYARLTRFRNYWLWARSVVSIDKCKMAAVKTELEGTVNSKKIACEDVEDEDEQEEVDQNDTSVTGNKKKKKKKKKKKGKERSQTLKIGL